MFRLEVLYFVGVLCVVNAAVTINIYDDDAKEMAMEEKSIEVKSCNNQACDRFCRALGFRRGVCVGDYCECDNMRINNIYLQNANKLESCNYQACDQLCRRLGFPGGACVGDSCKCDNFKNDHTEEMAMEEKSIEVKNCNNQACDRFCRALGFRRGVCVGDYCKCDNMRINNIYLQNANKLESCNYQGCDQLCRRLGFPGGACVGDSCKCDNFKNDLLSLLLNKKPLDLNEVSEKKKNNEGECSNSACEVNCQSLGLPGGYCTDGQCICDKNKNAGTLGACDVVACNEMCHRMNYIGGMCRQGSCHCY